ncbi:MAG: DHHA1 domain-containing protein, partial [Candidatus Theseobacter exili]|nr:DHHA1 domain-containing protein [Candidatus Theseobacter exili]
LVDLQSCSSGQIVFDLLTFLNIDISKEIAICLYASILSDTGGFRHGHGSIQAHKTAAALLSTGIDPQAVYRNVFENITLEKVLQLGKCLSKIKIESDGAIVWTVQEYPVIDSGIGASYRVVEIIRAINGVKIAVFFEENYVKNETHISFRSNDPDIDVARIACEFGGGGHREASGASVKMEDPTDIRETVIKTLQKVLE